MEIQKNNQSLKKIEIIKDLINPFIKNTNNKLFLEVSTFYDSKKIPNLNQLHDRISVEFKPEDFLDGAEEDKVSLDELTKFKKDFSQIIEKASKIYFIEDSNKPILIVYSNLQDSVLEDKCILFAGENKDLDDRLDFLILIGYNKIRISFKD